MRACNCGESLTRSVQENAAKRTVATTTRAQFCERAELFIALRASDSGRRCASNFLCGFPLPCRAKGREDAPHSKALRAKCPKAIDYFAKPFERVPLSASLISSISSVGHRCHSRLESNTMIGPGRFRRCPRAYALRPFRVLVVSVFIRGDEVPTEMSKMTPALENHSALKRLSFRRNDQAIVLAPCVPVRVTPVKFKCLEF
jgi:hypothetical protein